MTLERSGANLTWAALPLELVVGTIMFAHGLPKLMDTAGFAANALGGIPLFLAYLVVAAELGGGLLLLAGLLVRLGAFGSLCVMAVAVTQVHWSTGLTGRGGFEFPLALLAASIALLVLGPDPISIDRNAGLSLVELRDPGLRRDNTNVSSLPVKAAGIGLIAAGVALGFARHHLGLPGNLTATIIAAAVGLLSAILGVALVIGKPWAYLPAFLLARLYLAGSVLLLFWVKYALRGLAAFIISLIVLVALRSARRDMR